MRVGRKQTGPEEVRGYKKRRGKEVVGSLSGIRKDEKKKRVKKLKRWN